MTIDRDILLMMNQTAAVSKYKSVAQEGGITFNTSKNYPCLREYGNHLTTTKEGHDVTARMRIFVGPSSSGGFPTVTPQDKITISSSSPRIINADQYVDENGATYVECIHCG